ncbi:hypothetical protein JCM11251_003455 [Rhodosporidiobolus azoricus]
MSGLDESSWSTEGQINEAHRTISTTFLSGVSRPISWRKTQLHALGLMLQEKEKDLCQALEQDLHRPAFETITAELSPLKAEILEALAHVAKWAKPEKVKTSWMWAASAPTVYKEPKGEVLVIGTWNYPLSLLLGPLLGALSAGCTCILKPAEQAPATATLLARLLPTYLDSSAVRVIQGGTPQTQILLSLRFRHIFYTGSGKVGRIVAKAAAEKLCPVTLELGGKSPAVVLVEGEKEMEVVARRIAWGKWVNAGQICIAPDYVLTLPHLLPLFLKHFKAALAQFSASSQPAASSTSTSPSHLAVAPPSRIISPAHFERISSLLERTEGKVEIGGGKTDIGEFGKGGGEERRMEVTVVTGVAEGDALMSEEIFGPLLPVVTLPSKEEMVRLIRDKDETPLAMYVFSQKKAEVEYFRQNTSSGSFMHNDLLVQFMIPGLPFGGAGESGYGSYHGRKSFDTFTHERASASVPLWMDSVMALRYPPYTPKSLRLLLLVTGATIRRQTALGKIGLGWLIGILSVMAGAWAAARGKGYHV